MAAGRRPLFDLMTDPTRYPRGGTPPTNAATPAPPATSAPSPTPPPPLGPPKIPVRPARPLPVAAVETKPRPTRTEAPAEPPPREPEPRGRDGVVLPWASVYWIVTGFVTAAVILGALLWWGGFSAGGRDAAQRFGRDLESGVKNEPQASPEVQTPPHEPAGEAAQTPPPSPPPAKVVPGDLYGPEGWTGEDPRQAGMNYLRLATLSKSDAVRVIDYLKGRGKSALAVPSKAVDRGPDAGKNPSYFVYFLTPLSREQFRDGKSAVRIENELKAIGKDWSKSKERGPTDFSQPGWVKYEGR